MALWDLSRSVSKLDLTMLESDWQPKRSGDIKIPATLKFQTIRHKPKLGTYKNSQSGAQQQKSGTHKIQAHTKKSVGCAAQKSGKPKTGRPPKSAR